MSRHHWMYFGCQCSSARCRRLLLERLTLFGIFSAEIIHFSNRGARRDRGETILWVLSVLCGLGSFPVELRPALLAVHLQRPFFAHGVRPLEDPVLPRSEAAEYLRLHRFRSSEA